uniref:Uncharacterized protein n=1 Tax=Brassica campestris TaxID=3711 RepID=A0A3P6E2Z9_BRACM|nr:unnamed protein product [Brassica rapa]
MMKKNPRGKGVWSHTSDEAPWKICKVFAHVNERQPEAQSLSNKSYFKLERRKVRRVSTARKDSLRIGGGYSIHI